MISRYLPISQRRYHGRVPNPVHPVPIGFFNHSSRTIGYACADLFLQIPAGSEDPLD